MKPVMFVRSILVLAVLVLTAQAALAAEPSGPPPGAAPHGPPIERLAKELNLDETQKAQVTQILETQHARHQAAREQFRASGQRPDPETMRAQMQQDEAELTQQLSGVLNTEQLAKFKQMQAQRHQHRREGLPPASPAE
jgi:Spy/CpxP family protein refolding chaperone